LGLLRDQHAMEALHILVLLIELALADIHIQGKSRLGQE